MPTLPGALQDLRRAIGRRADLAPDTLAVLLREPDPRAAYRAALRRRRTRVRVPPPAAVEPTPTPHAMARSQPDRLARLPFIFVGIVAASAALIVAQWVPVAWPFQLLVVSLSLVSGAGLFRVSVSGDAADDVGGRDGTR